MAAQQPESNLDSILEILQDEPFIGGGPGEQVQLRGAVTKIANRWTPGKKCCPYFKLDETGKDGGVRKVDIPISFNPPRLVTHSTDAGNKFQYLVYRGLLQTKKFVFAKDDDQLFGKFHQAVMEHLPGNAYATKEGMHTLEMAVEKYNIRGRIDCLLEFVGTKNRLSPKPSRIIDFKWTEDKKNPEGKKDLDLDPDPTPQQGLQLLLYQWLLGKMRKDKDDVMREDKDDVMREDKDDVPADMFLIKYNDTRKELKRFLFKPPSECQYSKEKSDQEDFEGAIRRYMQLYAVIE